VEAQLKVQNLVSFVDALTSKCSAAVVPFYRVRGAHLTSSKLRSGCILQDWYLSNEGSDDYRQSQSQRHILPQRPTPRSRSIVLIRSATLSDEQSRQMPKADCRLPLLIVHRQAPSVIGHKALATHLSRTNTNTPTTLRSLPSASSSRARRLGSCRTTRVTSKNGSDVPARL
jgi:hypothetical protein